MKYLTPPELAKRWRSTPEVIINHIRAGRLRAFTLSPPGSQRPRWRITEAAAVAFEEGQQPPQPATPKRRQRRDPDVIQFIK